MREDAAKTVLVIDDDPLVLEALCGFLETEGIGCLAAGSGSLGLRMARVQRPDLVISDYEMPGLDGCSVYQLMREDESTAGIPFIFFTAHRSPALHQHCMRLGAAAVLEKGETMDRLAETVHRLLMR
jgi:CheY-like chemotaxis protein